VGDQLVGAGRSTGPPPHNPSGEDGRGGEGGGGFVGTGERGVGVDMV